MDYVIYRDSWRRGGNGGSERELLAKYGPTSLYNEQFSLQCCLGQCAVEAGIPLKYINDIAEPYDIRDMWDESHNMDDLELLLAKGGLLEQNDEHVEHRMAQTEFVNSAIEINDDEEITDDIREALLTEVSKKYGHNITFVDGLAPWFANPRGWEYVE